MIELTWRPRLSSEEIAEVLALLDAATEADGQSPVSEAALLRLRHGEPAAHLLASAGTACVETANSGVRNGRHAGIGGYAQLGPDGAGELVVHPGYRGHGVGDAMVRALVERAGGGGLRLWAHGGHPGAKRLARKHGFTEARVLWQMRRSLLAPLDAPRLPDGVALRPFRVGQDEAAVVEVNNKAFAWHPEQGGWDVEQVRQREAQPWFDPAGFLVAVSEDGGRVLGFHWTKAHGAELGEVYVLAVDPAEHGRGLGTALTLAGLRHLRSRGMTTVMLYVEADNAPAIRTYERLGFAHSDTDVAYSAP